VPNVTIVKISGVTARIMESESNHLDSELITLDELPKKIRIIKIDRCGFDSKTYEELRNFNG